MSEVRERVAAFDEDFKLAQPLYADMRNLYRGVDYDDTHQWFPRRYERDTIIDSVDKIASEVMNRPVNEAQPLDNWIASQALRVDAYEPYPTIPGHKKYFRSSLQTVDKLRSFIDDQHSSHIAILTNNGATLFPSNGNRDLVIDTADSHPYIDQGIFVKLSKGLDVSVSHADTGSSYVIKRDANFRQPIMVTQRHKSIGKTVIPPKQIDEEVYSSLPIYLGNENQPKNPEDMYALTAEDKHRFGLRAAAYIGGIASWLTIERPQEGFRNRLVKDVATEVADLVTKGATFDSVQQSARIAYRNSSRNPLRRIYTETGPPRLADMGLKEIKAIIHGGGVSISDVSEETTDLIGRRPKTMREIAGQIAAKRAITEFFEVLSE